MTKAPSDIHSCLTDERINHIGHLISRVRAENLESTDHRDNGWSIGCRAHAWISSEIISEAQIVPWLEVVDSSLRFIGKIDSVEFSFYRGMATKPKNNIYNRAQTHPELRQYSMLFDTPVPEKLVWVYAVETDREGTTTNIEFFGMSESGEVIASHTVPLYNDTASLYVINNIESNSTDLPPAPVSLPKIKKTNKTGNSSQ